jgi:hypothetical protein
LRIGIDQSGAKLRHALTPNATHVCTSMTFKHTFQDVAIAAATLSGAGGDACIQAASRELLSHKRVNLADLEALLELALHVVGGL